MNTDDTIEQAHLAIIRHEYMQARQLLDSVLQTEPHNPEAMRLLSELRDQENHAFNPAGTNISASNNTFWQLFNTDSWTPYNYVMMIFILPAVSLWMGSRPFEEGMAHHFALSTQYYVTNRYGEGRHETTIWLGLAFSAVLILLGLASFVLLVLRIAQRLRR